MKKRSQKLRTNILLLSIGPLILFGITVLLITSRVVYSSLREEVRYSMDILVHSSLSSYQALQTGRIKPVKNEMLQDLSGEDYLELVDHMKQISGADITVFSGKFRTATTILQGDGSRAVGTAAEPEVVECVLEKRQEFFSDDVKVNGVPYFGYYIPLVNSDQEVTGMLFAGKARRNVMKKVWKNIILICLCDIAVMAFVITVVSYYSKKIVYTLNKTKQFLGEIANGDLKAEIDPYILERQDELGGMGRFTVMLKNSITDLVGKDPLTGLHNRRCCDIILENLAEESRRKNQIFTVVMGDIDLFKRVNDQFGHQAGDEVLIMVAEKMRTHMEQLGFVFRWGGEEFLLAYEEMGRESASVHLHRLHQELADSFVLWKGEKISITLTFGTADFSEESDVQKLIQLADQRLMIGKQNGRNRIV